MTRLEAWFLRLATIAVAVTGLVYGWMLYFTEPLDEFALVNHPAQPQWAAAHLLAAPVLLFAVGAIWRVHVWTSLRSGRRSRRRTGLVLAVLLGPMAASGYLLQVSVDEAWRERWVVVHVATSLLWLATYAAHLLLRRDLDLELALASLEGAGSGELAPREDRAVGGEDGA